MDYINVDDMPGATDDERLAEALRRQSQQDPFPAIVLGRGPYTLPPVTRTPPLTGLMTRPDVGAIGHQPLTDEDIARIYDVPMEFLRDPCAAQPPDILDRINNTLTHFADAQTGRGDEWPFRSF